MKANRKADLTYGIAVLNPQLMPPLKLIVPIEKITFSEKVFLLFNHIFRNLI